MENMEKCSQFSGTSVCVLGEGLYGKVVESVRPPRRRQTLRYLWFEGRLPAHPLGLTPLTIEASMGIFTQLPTETDPIDVTCSDKSTLPTGAMDNQRWRPQGRR